MKTPAEFIQETTGPFIQKHPNALSDADAAVIFDREEKRRQKQYAKAVKEAKKDPEYMDSGFTVAGDLVIWKRPVIDPRVAVLMSQILRPADIVFGKPCKRCASEARYHSGACIVCNRARKRAYRDFFSKQLPLFQVPRI